MRPAAPSAASGAPNAAPERVVARLRRHGRILILPALLVIVVAGATSYLVVILPEAWQRISVLVAAALLVLVGAGLPYLAWLTRRTTITTRRVILRSGVFVRTRRDLLHSRGYALSVRRGVLQRISGSGDVRIDAGHEQPIVVLRDVPRAEVVLAALHELTEDAVAQGFARDAPGPDGDTVAWGGR